MNRYRIEVKRARRLWCVIDWGGPSACVVLEDLISRFPVTEGFELTAWRVTAERRLLESGPEGIRMLAAEPVLERIDLAVVVQTLSDRHAIETGNCQSKSRLLQQTHRL